MRVCVILWRHAVLVRTSKAGHSGALLHASLEKEKTEMQQQKTVEGTENRKENGMNTNRSRILSRTRELRLSFCEGNRTR